MGAIRQDVPVSEQPSAPPSGGTAYTTAWSGLFLALLSGMPIAISVFFALQDWERNSWQFALVSLGIGAITLAAGATMALLRRPAGAGLITAGSVLVLVGSIAVTVSWEQAYGNVAYFVAAVALVAVVVFVLSVLPATRSFLRHPRAAAEKS